MFKKNSIEFFIGLNYYLYYFTSGYTLKSYSHKSSQNVLWSHDSGHVVWLLRFPCYLYLDPIVCLDVVDQMPKCTGNYFLLGALITLRAFIFQCQIYFWACEGEFKEDTEKIFFAISCFHRVALDYFEPFISEKVLAQPYDFLEE